VDLFNFLFQNGTIAVKHGTPNDKKSSESLEMLWK